MMVSTLDSSWGLIKLETSPMREKPNGAILFPMFHDAYECCFLRFLGLAFA